MNRGPMELDVQTDGSVTVAKVSGPISAAHSPELRVLIAGAIEAGRGVIIDLGECDYMDSSGIATLVEGVQLADQNKKPFILTGQYSEKVKHLFEITRLDAFFEEYHCDTVEAAKEKLLS